jgi:hypothetical protein
MVVPFLIGVGFFFRKENLPEKRIFFQRSKFSFERAILVVFQTVQNNGIPEREHCHTTRQGEIYVFISLQEKAPFFFYRQNPRYGIAACLTLPA